MLHVVLYKNTIKKITITLQIRLHENKKMRKGMRTRTALGLVKRERN